MCVFVLFSLCCYRFNSKLPLTFFFFFLSSYYLISNFYLVCFHIMVWFHLIVLFCFLFCVCLLHFAPFFVQ